MQLVHTLHFFYLIPFQTEQFFFAWIKEIVYIFITMKLEILNKKDVNYKFVLKNNYKVTYDDIAWLKGTANTDFVIKCPKLKITSIYKRSPTQYLSNILINIFINVFIKNDQLQKK